MNEFIYKGNMKQKLYSLYNTVLYILGGAILLFVVLFNFIDLGKTISLIIILSYILLFVIYYINTNFINPLIVEIDDRELLIKVFKGKNLKYTIPIEGSGFSSDILRSQRSIMVSTSLTLVEHTSEKDINHYFSQLGIDNFSKMYSVLQSISINTNNVANNDIVNEILINNIYHLNKKNNKRRLVKSFIYLTIFTLLVCIYAYFKSVNEEMDVLSFYMMGSFVTFVFIAAIILITYHMNINKQPSVIETTNTYISIDTQVFNYNDITKIEAAPASYDTANIIRKFSITSNNIKYTFNLGYCKDTNVKEKYPVFKEFSDLEQDLLLAFSTRPGVYHLTLDKF